MRCVRRSIHSPVPIARRIPHPSARKVRALHRGPGPVCAPRTAQRAAALQDRGVARSHVCDCAVLDAMGRPLLKRAAMQRSAPPSKDHTHTAESAASTSNQDAGVAVHQVPAALPGRPRRSAVAMGSDDADRGGADPVDASRAALHDEEGEAGDGVTEASAAGRSASPGGYHATPFLRQYLEVKERYADCIVFFRMGDFYEMFFDDAVVASQLLDLTLTARDKQRDTPIPMAGVPHHAGKHYIAKLVAAGKKVAVCEQVEDARKAKKIVRRAVTQVITPGVILEEDHLEPKSGHYLAAVCFGDGQAGIAHVDVSTGEFSATLVPLSDASEELGRIAPAELLVVTPDESVTGDTVSELSRRLRIPVGQSHSQPPREDLRLLQPLLPAPGTRDDADRTPPHPLIAAAGAACIRYAQATQPTGALPIFRLRIYQPGDSLIVDETTRVNLELLQTLMERKRQGSLIGVLDHTKTAMGGRLLRRWLLAPLLDLAPIRRRHDAVEWLVEHQMARQAVREHLGEIYDLERLAGRLGAGVATPRDLYSLGQGLLQLPALVAALQAGRDQMTMAIGAADRAADAGTDALQGLPALLHLGDDLCQDIATRIRNAIVDNPPLLWREGGFTCRGWNTELDRVLDLSQGGKDHILRIEERERERSGISSLKVRYNKVFGDYIEITRSNLARVPADYIRKQTTANAERFVTSELAEYETKVLHAEERRIELELELFETLRRELATETSRILALAERVAQLDTLASLAELAHKSGYVRPDMTTDLRLHIEEGRHPVVEHLAQRGSFVPNDTLLDPDAEQILILTGPNMAGKSTVMRQVALIVLLAQMGSFVPARRAELGLVDRICTRVGASDNLARGESTFMVEMRETSQILTRATRRSLVVLDEIGRGTSTYDGVSIAWAVAEYLHDAVGCRTLFATHYHELAALAEARPRVRNFSVAVRQWQGDIVFLHKLVPGGANRSYGIEVARLAGLPASVVERARQLLRELEAGGEGTAAGGATPAHGLPRSSQLPLFTVAIPAAPMAHTTTPAPPIDSARERAEDEVLDALRALEPDDLTPRQALEKLAALRSRLLAKKSPGKLARK